MKKRNILTSVAASTMIASVLMLSGCGGSSAEIAKTLPNLGEGDSTAVGSAKIVADSNGNLNVKVPLVSENKQVQVAEVTFNKILKNGAVTCTQLADNCGVKAKQISACGIDAGDTAFTNAKSHLGDLIAGAGDRYDANRDMVVFGGILGITAEGFNQATMALAINMIDCGSAFKTDGTPVKAGFSNEGHIVDVYVENGDLATKSRELRVAYSGTWIRNVRIKDGKIYLTPEQLGSLNLPATFTFYSIKESNKEGTTGVTGGNTGGAGY
jgi:hypothetical protein